MAAYNQFANDKVVNIIGSSVATGWKISQDLGKNKKKLTNLGNCSISFAYSREISQDLGKPWEDRGKLLPLLDLVKFLMIEITFEGCEDPR